MTKDTLPASHPEAQGVTPYADQFHIGQAACARNRLAIAVDGLRRSSARLLSTEYEPAETLPMWSRLHRDARVDYDLADGVLSPMARNNP